MPTIQVKRPSSFAMGKPAKRAQPTRRHSAPAPLLRGDSFDAEPLQRAVSPSIATAPNLPKPAMGGVHAGPRVPTSGHGTSKLSDTVRYASVPARVHGPVEDRDGVLKFEICIAPDSPDAEPEYFTVQVTGAHREHLKDLGPEQLAAQLGRAIELINKDPAAQGFRSITFRCLTEDGALASAIIHKNDEDYVLGGREDHLVPGTTQSFSAELDKLLRDVQDAMGASNAPGGLFVKRRTPRNSVIESTPAAGDDIDAYVAKMRQKGTWGGTPELQALARHYNVNISVFNLAAAGQSFAAAANFEVPTATRSMQLLFDADAKHYALIQAPLAAGSQLRRRDDGTFDVGALRCGQVPGDGDCLFAAVGLGVDQPAAAVRAAACDTIAASTGDYAELIEATR